MEGDSPSDITVDLSDGGHWLVIRNVAADGKPSVLLLFDIQAFPAEAVQEPSI